MLRSWLFLLSVLIGFDTGMESHPGVGRENVS